MSTKIYNGIRIEADDLQTVHKICMELKEQWTEYTRAFFNKHDIETLCKIGKLLRERGSKNLRTPGVDFDLGIAVYPYFQDGVKFIGIIFCDHNEFFEQFLLEHPLISEYGYWNNTDKPDEVTDEQWEQRRNVWDGCIQYGQPPKNTMWCLTLVEGEYVLLGVLFEKREEEAKKKELEGG